MDGGRAQGVGKFLSWTGPLLPLSAVSLALGATVQVCSSRVGLAYTWMEPLVAAEKIWRSAHFPLVVALVMAMGAFTRRRALLRSWKRRAGFSVVERRWFAALAITAGALDHALFAGRAWEDSLAAGLIIAGLAFHARSVGWLESSTRWGVSAIALVCVSYAFTVLKASVFLDRDPMDPWIIEFERLLTGHDLYRDIANWAAHETAWVAASDWIYSQLFNLLLLSLAFLVGSGERRRLQQVSLAFGLCYLLGGLLYLTMPAAGPVFAHPERFGYLHHQSLDTNWLQYALKRNTSLVVQGNASRLITWGYIACMPSLHIAQLAVTVSAARRSAIALGITLGVLGLTSFAVLVLGWHYATDVVGGLALALGALLLADGLRRAWDQLTRRIRRPAPAPTPQPVLIPEGPPPALQPTTPSK